jgi:hypothetical protein
MGQPTSHATGGRFAEFELVERFTLGHVIDPVSGLTPYESKIEVAFHPSGERVRMVVTLHPHRDAHWTKRSVMGFTSQLNKLDKRVGATGP